MIIFRMIANIPMQFNKTLLKKRLLFSYTSFYIVNTSKNFKLNQPPHLRLQSGSWRSTSSLNTGLHTIVNEENEYFHKFLENSSNYRQYLLTPPKFTDISHFETEESSSSTNIFNIISRNSQEQNLTVLFDENFQNMLIEWSNNIHQLPDAELFRNLELLTLVNFGKAYRLKHLRFTLAFALSNEFTKRGKQWSVQTCLKAADIFYYLKFSQIVGSKFIDKMYKYRVLSETMSHEEIIVTLYHASLCRKCSHYLLNELTCNIEKSLSCCSPDEVGIICLGNFKCKNLKAKSFHFSVTQYLIENIEDMTSLSLSSIAKYLTSASHDGYVKKFDVQQIDNLMTTIGEKSASWNIKSVLHAFSMFDRWRYTNSTLIQNFKVLIQNSHFESWRLKDLAKLSMLLGNMSVLIEDVQTILNDVVKEISSPYRLKETSEFVHTICLAFDGMTRAGVYSTDMFRLVFDANGLKYFNNFELNYWTYLSDLLARVKVENPKLLQEISPASLLLFNKEGRKKKVNISESRLIYIEDLVKTISVILGGENYAKQERTLSFDNDDIQLCFLNNGDAVPVNKWEKIDRNSCVNVLLVMQSTKDFYKVVDKNLEISYHLTGYSNMKLRVLNKLGYQTISVVQNDYYKTDNKTEYVKELIDQALQNNRQK